MFISYSDLLQHFDGAILSCMVALVSANLTAVRSVRKPLATPCLCCIPSSSVLSSVRKEAWIN